MNVAQSPPLGFLHNHAHRFVVALKVPLHGPEHPGFGRHRIQSLIQLAQILFQFLPAFLPGLLPEGITGNGIIRRCHGFLGSIQLAAGVFQIGLGFMMPDCTGSQISVQLFQPFPGLNHALFQAPDIRLPACNVRSQRRFFSPQFQKLPGHALGIGGHGCQLLLKLIQFLPLFRKSGFNFGNPGVGLINLSYNAPAAILLALQFLLDPGKVGQVVLHISLENRHLPLQLLMGSAEHIHFQPDGFQISIPGAQRLCQFLRLAVKRIQVIMGLLQHKGCRGIVLFRLFCRGRELLQSIQPDGHFYPFQFPFQFQVLFCLLRLHLQRFQLQFQLGYLVPDAQQIVLGVFQLPLGLFFPVTILGDARRFLKDFPAVSAFQGEDLINSALADVGVALPAQTGVHEQLMDILQTGGLFVDIEFAVPGAVKPPGHHHFIRIIGQSTVGVVQRQGCLRKAHRRTLLGTAEDHILHFGSPEGLGTLLTHDPQNSIGNVGLSGAVGADDGRNVRTEANQGLVRKGLESLQFQRF